MKLSAVRQFEYFSSPSPIYEKVNPSSNCVIYFNKSPFKMMKNAFYFILKPLFALKIFKFLSSLFGHTEETASLETKS